MEDCKRNNNDRRDSDRRVKNIVVSMDRRQSSRRTGVDRRELAKK